MSPPPNIAFNPSPTMPMTPGGSPQVRDLGLLSDFDGKWSGEGLNVIWRPRFGGSPDVFFALNRTADEIVFNQMDGVIPNRGQKSDVFMSGLHYFQHIVDATTGDTLHMEPGIWARVPQTSDPDICDSIVRMASIPHGTALLAQGTASLLNGPLEFPVIDLTPFSIGTPQPKVHFFDDQMNLQKASDARTPDEQLHGVTQGMVTDPNSLLRDALDGMTVQKVIEINVSSFDGKPVPGGGTRNVAFLGNSQPANASATMVTSTFWIVTAQKGGGEPSTMILYTQTVLLDFNGLSWPHVTVAVLRKSPTNANTDPSDVSPTLTPGTGSTSSTPTAPGTVVPPSTPGGSVALPTSSPAASPGGNQPSQSSPPVSPSPTGGWNG